MEGCFHGRLFPWKVVSMEGCFHGRLFPWKVVSMEGCFHGRLFPWKVVSMEGCFHGRLFPWKVVSMEGYFHGRLVASFSLPTPTCYIKPPPTREKATLARMQAVHARVSIDRKKHPARSAEHPPPPSDVTLAPALSAGGRVLGLRFAGPGRVAMAAGAGWLGISAGRGAHAALGMVSAPPPPPSPVPSAPCGAMRPPPPPCAPPVVAGVCRAACAVGGAGRAPGPGTPPALRSGPSPFQAPAPSPAVPRGPSPATHDGAPRARGRGRALRPAAAGTGEGGGGGSATIPSAPPCPQRSRATPPPPPPLSPARGAGLLGRALRALPGRSLAVWVAPPKICHRGLGAEGPRAHCWSGFSGCETRRRPPPFLGGVPAAAFPSARGGHHSAISVFCAIAAASLTQLPCVHRCDQLHQVWRRLCPLQRS